MSHHYTLNCPDPIKQVTAKQAPAYVNNRPRIGYKALHFDHLLQDFMLEIAKPNLELKKQYDADIHQDRKW